ncbi:MAG: response regulator [Candidatus Hydrogenedentes bacterium]|nr:response regulator [Candidatus Hydrogenedentota bacterium]
MNKGSFRNIAPEVRRSLFKLAAAFLCCSLLEAAARIAFWQGWINAAVRDTAGLTVYVLVSFISIWILRQLDSLRWIRNLIGAGMGLLILSQVFDSVDDLEAVRWIPVLMENNPVQGLLENVLFTLGALCVLMGCFSALLLGDLSCKDLAEEHVALNRAIEERERAESALAEARDQLVLEVARKTEALADRNAQLQEELAVRQQAESDMARQLRYEDGLAECSAHLLAKNDGDAGIDRALHHLLRTSLAHRVSMFENAPGLDGTLFRRVFHACEETSTGPARDEGAYREGLNAWQETLRRGGYVEKKGVEVSVAERFFLSPRTGSFILLPLGWEGGWRGFLAFEDASPGRLWSSDEVRMLQTVTEMIGISKDRHFAEEALRKAKDNLEQEVTARTRDLQESNTRLQREILERRRIEERNVHLGSQLRQAKKMQAIGTLAGGIAHDFNNLLSSIIGYPELALSRIEEDHPHARYFREILKAGNRAKELVRQVLLFSRQAEQQRMPVALDILANECLDRIQESLPANILLERHFAPGLPEIEADAAHMQHVVQNVCTNALQAMRSEGGLLCVTLGSEVIPEERMTAHGMLYPGAYLKLEISDTGPGMDLATMDRIFDPFFTTKSVADGTGMGLPVVHGIVTEHGGAIHVRSQLGEGSVFTIYLPAAGNVARAESTERAAARKKHVLIVDDEPQLVDLWSELLEHFGFTVTSHNRSPEALEAFKRNPDAFDVVLLDQTMPEMTGAELAAAILAIRENLPIIMATGFSNSIHPEEARQIGIREFVYKPIVGEELYRTVKRVLD